MMNILEKRFLVRNCATVARKFMKFMILEKSVWKQSRYKEHTANSPKLVVPRTPL